MSGAQGAHPVGEKTATEYGSVGGGENRTRTDLRPWEDQGAIQVEKVQGKLDDAAPRGVDARAFGGAAQEEGRGRGRAGAGAADPGATGAGAGA